MSLLGLLDRIDKILFVLIHNDADHSILDQPMLFLRNPYTWIPLYAFMLLYVIKKGENNAWQFILLSILTFSITDIVTSHLLKPFFERLRPCWDPELHRVIRSLVNCGGTYSFPSSHAANHFGLATFWYWSLWLMTDRKWNWLWVWAIVICYAQVYVGKHYPLDVLAGGFFGWMVGATSAKIFHRWAYNGKKIYPEIAAA
ncbi:MAG TPA: phosphatase PAP2 family protein [Puia sp.]|jgi:membrane-associated phospholipid phosphatase|nr:phosphatase PAP2 family protein [Puia sp.]